MVGATRCLVDSDNEEEGSKEDEHHLSGEEDMWPPSDDDDAQELTAVDPDYGLATFFDATERSITAPIRPSNFPPMPATLRQCPQSFLPLSPISALQREGLEWLDKLERVEAEADTAYAEMERIAIKLENGGDEYVALKLEAAEIRFEEAQKKEKEVATAAVWRVQALQAQAKRGRLAGQPNVEECVEPTILLGVNEPTIKSEIVEEVLVPTVKVEVDTKPDAVDLEVSPAKVETEHRWRLRLNLSSSPNPLIARSRWEATQSPALSKKARLNTKGEAEAVKTNPKVKETPKAKGEPTSHLILPNKSELDTVVFGTFQPLEPEEIEELVTSFAPLSATIVQLDPAAVIVPPGLIDLSKSRAYAQASEEQQVVVNAEPAEVDLNDEYVPPFFEFPNPTHRRFWQTGHRPNFLFSRRSCSTASKLKYAPASANRT
jgi:hypothetical protein